MSERKLEKDAAEKKAVEVHLHPGLPNAPGLIHLWTVGKPTYPAPYVPTKKKYWSGSD